MAATLEARIVECMKPLFGEFAATALEQQKAKLGIGGRLGADECRRLVQGIRTMCSQVAGPAVADRVYRGLLAIVREAA